MPERPRRWRALALVVGGFLVGTLIVQPVGAHFLENTRHLGVHAWSQFIKDRVYSQNQIDNRFYNKNQSNNLFPRRLFAQVNADATVATGIGVVDVLDSGTGKYDVKFAVPVENCAVVANAHSTDPRIVRADPAGTAVADFAVVDITDAAGTFVDADFSVVAIC